jgi:hypothetical protein
MSKYRHDISQDIQLLKEKVAKSKLEMERAHAVTACANLMNKYQYYHMRGMRKEETELFALKSPGACVEMLWGIYDEPEGVLRWKEGEGYGKPRSSQKGVLPLHAMTTPVIEVAKDGQTAKGLWLMMGTESGKFPGEEKAQAMWASAIFAMDFIKEDGEWKIWKYITTGGFKSPFEKGWHRENPTRADIERDIERALSGQAFAKPDRRPSYPWLWNPDEHFQNIPPVPLPYETWDDSLACVPVPGAQWEIKNFD